MSPLWTRCTGPRDSGSGFCPCSLSYLNHEMVGGRREKRDKTSSWPATPNPRRSSRQRRRARFFLLIFASLPAIPCLVGFGEASIFCSSTMNFHDAGRRIPKRRRTSYMKSIVQLPDLNSPPAEGTGVGVPTSRMAVSHNQASSSVPPAADGPQTGIQSAPIDVVVIDDDVMIYPPRSFPQTRQRSTRTEPITVIIDDDSETNLEPAGDTLDEHVNTLLSLGINRRHVLPRVSNNCPVISLLDTPEVSSKPTVLQTPPEPVKDIPKEPKFTCPICLNELTEASSTSCGHIFCKKCIKAAIQAQKKCPTCRKKLSGHNVHRVYLPTME